MASWFTSAITGRKMRVILPVIAASYIIGKLYKYCKIRYRRYQIEKAKYKPKVVIVGAGFAGLMHAIKLKQLGFEDFIILERHDGVGGTWYG